MDEYINKERLLDIIDRIPTINEEVVLISFCRWLIDNDMLVSSDENIKTVDDVVSLYMKKGGVRDGK